MIKIFLFPLRRVLPFLFLAMGSLFAEEEPCKLKEASQPGQVKKDAFVYMDQLVGWCSRQKASFLVEQILMRKPETIVEIGVYGGKSLVPMAYALKINGRGKIYGIDPWSAECSLEGVQNASNIAYWGTQDYEAVLYHLIKKIEKFDLGEQVELIRATSKEAPLIQGIDLLHIDGNHSEHTSYFDVTKWVPLVKEGGLIIFDDMTWYENGTFTTAKAVKWLDERCTKLAEFSDACVWGVWIKS